jgi:nicotinamidase-related amidase
MSWKTAFRSFYYAEMVEPPPVMLSQTETALLVIDLQACYLPDAAPTEQSEMREWQRWAPFRERMRQILIPNAQRLLKEFRGREMDVFFARIACLTPDGRDRSLSQARPGFNNLLLPKDEAESQIIEDVAPLPHEIVVLKTTDSALTGTNLRLVLGNMGIKNVVVCGIFTDQCVSSTVRSLADENFNVVVVHDACAAATDELHNQELTAT